MSGGGAGADADAQEAQTLLQLVSSMERSKQEASIFVPLSFFFSLVTEREVSASGLHSKMCAPTCNFQKSKHTHTHTHTHALFGMQYFETEVSAQTAANIFFCFFCVFIIFCVHYFLVFRKRGLRTNSAGGLTCCSAVVCASHVCCVRVCRISRMAYCRMCSPTVECVLLV